MTNPPQLTLNNARIPAPSADPTLVRWLRNAGVARFHANQLANGAARQMQFMPADVKAAYRALLTEPSNEPEPGLIARARQTLFVRSEPDEPYTKS